MKLFTFLLSFALTGTSTSELVVNTYSTNEINVVNLNIDSSRLLNEFNNDQDNIEPLTNLPFPNYSINADNTENITSLFLDRKGDSFYANSNQIPSNEKILNVSSASKETWYNIEHKSLTINTLDYFDGGKEEFLLNKSYVIPTINLAYNMKASSWLDSSGKNKPFIPTNFQSIKLTGEYNETSVFNKTAHGDNERVSLTFIESWKDDTLVLSWRLNSFIYWSRGSLIGHTAFIRVTGGQFLFLNESDSNSIEIGELSQGSSWKTNKGIGTIPTNKIFSDALTESKRNRNAIALATNGFYTTVYKVGKVTYIYYLHMSFPYPTNAINYDLTTTFTLGFKSYFEGYFSLETYGNYPFLVYTNYYYDRDVYQLDMDPYGILGYNTLTWTGSTTSIYKYNK